MEQKILAPWQRSDMSFWMLQIMPGEVDVTQGIWLDTYPEVNGKHVLPRAWMSTNKQNE